MRSVSAAASRTPVSTMSTDQPRPKPSARISSMRSAVPVSDAPTATNAGRRPGPYSDRQALTQARRGALQGSCRADPPQLAAGGPRLREGRPRWSSTQVDGPHRQASAGLRSDQAALWPASRATRRTQEQASSARSSEPKVECVRWALHDRHGGDVVAHLRRNRPSASPRYQLDDDSQARVRVGRPGTALLGG